IKLAGDAYCEIQFGFVNRQLSYPWIGELSRSVITRYFPRADNKQITQKQYPSWHKDVPLLSKTEVVCFYTNMDRGINGNAIGGSNAICFVDPDRPGRRIVAIDKLLLKNEIRGGKNVTY